MTTLESKIDSYQKENYIPFEEWNEKEHYCIIALCDEKHNATSLIKTFVVDFSNRPCITYTTTEEPKEALHFTATASTMLYHYLNMLSESNVNHRHVPVKTKPTTL